MKISKGVYVLEVTSDSIVGVKSVYPTVIEHNGELVLFDTCFPGQYEGIVSEFNKEGLDIKKLTKIVLTDQDIDHSGNISEILADTSNVEILAHSVETPYLNGEKTPVKQANMEANYNNLPDNVKELCDKFKVIYAKNRVDIIHELEDGDVLDLVGGVEVIFTPGHTPGHTCYYLKESKVLIGGDMLAIRDGELAIAPENMNYDNVEIKKSIEKLLNYDIETVVTFHGGTYTKDIKLSLEKLSR